MELDDEVCLCFHVSKRKILNYIRVRKPRKAAQLSECFGAGTGCGWCRKLLVRYFEHATAEQAAANAPAAIPDEPTRETHREERRLYIRERDRDNPS